MDKRETDWKDYETTLAGFRHLADIRFHLLAALPAVSGFAIGVTTFNIEAFKAEPGPRLMVGLLGFAITLGLTFYDQRNTQLYNALAGRAKRLEAALGLFEGGQFTSRPGRTRQFGGVIDIWHDRALALIYGSVLGAWLFPVLCGVLWIFNAGPWLRARGVAVPALAGVLAAIGAVFFVLELHRLDRGTRVNAESP